MTAPETSILTTDRLELRPFRPSDAADVQRLAGDPDVARTTLNVPHPYEDGMAEAWIETHAEQREAGTNLVYAIADRATGALIGTINVVISKAHERGELGYWIGKRFWGQGYCTEAARALVDCCFDRLGLNRVFAHHLEGNPASGRVMEKVGMRREGRLRQQVSKDGKLLDVIAYGMVRDDRAASVVQ